MIEVDIASLQMRQEDILNSAVWMFPFLTCFSLNISANEKHCNHSNQVMKPYLPYSSPYSSQTCIPLWWCYAYWTPNCTVIERKQRLIFKLLMKPFAYSGACYWLVDAISFQTLKYNKKRLLIFLYKQCLIQFHVIEYSLTSRLLCHK